MSKVSQKPPILAWVERLQSEGRYTFTRPQAEAETGRSPVAAQNALRRLREQGRIASPRRGFYLVVPPEYRATGAPPASWFIDALMRYVDQPYYVGLLSSAAIHGAAHQQPMAFQVVTDRPTRDAHAGAVTIRFSMDSAVERMPVVQKQTETGAMRVATPETTAFDLVRHQSSAGHLSNALTVLSELTERLRVKELVTVASLVRVPDVQRLGYLLEKAGADDMAMRLSAWLGDRRPRPVLLRPGGPADVETDRRWHILVNESLESDL